MRGTSPKRLRHGKRPRNCTRMTDLSAHGEPIDANTLPSRMIRGLFAGLVGGLWLISSPASAAWQEAKSKHFAIYADEDPRLLQAFATKLEKFDKAVRIVRSMDDPPVGDGGRLTVYVLND